ncbi:MAG: hypothetical protein A2593_05385 [Candidatus Moranbacteria bacterium RIFOXYD1_FULL_44_9]|nr:MAG: hypothetical protein A2593_05385 [Candidatus Moranbacteria bacterium RIFOXYD1_FULL_44_9]
MNQRPHAFIVNRPKKNIVRIEIILEIRIILLLFVLRRSKCAWQNAMDSRRREAVSGQTRRSALFLFRGMMVELEYAR